MERTEGLSQRRAPVEQGGGGGSAGDDAPLRDPRGPARKTSMLDRSMWVFFLLGCFILVMFLLNPDFVNQYIPIGAYAGHLSGYLMDIRTITFISVLMVFNLCFISTKLGYIEWD